MRLCNIAGPEGTVPCAAAEKGLVPLKDLGFPGSMRDLIDAGEETLRELKEALASWTGDVIDPEEAVFADVTLPGKILCVGLNYKKHAEETEAENRELLIFVKEALDGKLADCVISRKLVSGAVCLTTKGSVSLEMERYFASLPEAVSGGQTVKAERVLELNPDHEVFAALKKAFAEDREKAADYARLLYGQAELAAGVPLEDTAEFNRLMCRLMK